MNNFSIEQLDPAQAAAVTSDAQNILVVAGAGSGKTRVLTERIKYLLANGVDPSDVVAITFTNMAADEMKARLADVDNIGDAFIGTIHSFANRIYKNSDEPYHIMTEEQEQLIYEEIFNLPKYKGQLTIKKWLKFKDAEKLAATGRIDESEAWEILSPSERNVLYACKGDFERIYFRLFGAIFGAAYR